MERCPVCGEEMDPLVKPWRTWACTELCAQMQMDDADEGERSLLDDESDALSKGQQS